MSPATCPETTWFFPGPKPSLSLKHQKQVWVTSLLSFAHDKSAYGSVKLFAQSGSVPLLLIPACEGHPPSVILKYEAHAAQATDH